MNVFVTGGAGFIGSHVVEHHLARGDEVVALDDLSTGVLENLAPFLDHPRFRFVRGDVLTWTGLDAVAGWAQRIYHLAAVVGMFRVLQSPLAVTRVNVDGCARVLEAASRARHAPQVVVASSSSVYGLSDAVQLREDAVLHFGGDHPLTPYAVSKLTNELQAAAFATERGVRVVAARLFNAVGRRQRATYGFVLPRFVEQALAGKPLTVFGDGSQTRSFCDVRDTVAMLDLLGGEPAAWGQVVNVGNDAEITIGELAELVRRASPRPATIEYVPFRAAYGCEFRQTTQRRPVLERMRALIGYRHRFALASTVAELLAERDTAPLAPPVMLPRPAAALPVAHA